MRWKNLNQRYADRLTTLSAMAPHELFGISVDSSSEEIKTAYIRMVKAYHPDVSDPLMARHNQEVLKLINAAYEKLKEDR
jgi:DnaJ-class molecular chaperone